MKLPVIPLLLLSLPAFSSAQVRQAHLRVITIAKAGSTTSLGAATPSTPGSEARLFDRLMKDVAAGKASIVEDQETICRGGQRTAVKAARHFPFPVSYPAPDAAGRTYAASFQTRLVGGTLEAELTSSDDSDPGTGRRLLDVNFAPESNALLGRFSSPLPDLSGPQSGKAYQFELITVRQTCAQLLTWSGNTVLVSVSHSPDASLSEKATPWHYQFVRAGLDSEKPAPPDAVRTETGPWQRRLHAVTIRLSRQEAAALTLGADAGDAALYSRLKSMVDEGKATLAGHSAVHCREGQRSKITSNVLFPNAVLDRIHGSVELYGKEIGETLEAEALPPGHPERMEGSQSMVTVIHEAEDTHSYWNLALERQRDVEQIPRQGGTGQSESQAAVTEYIDQVLASQFRIPQDGVLCIGAVSSSPATEPVEFNSNPFFNPDEHGGTEAPAEIRGAGKDGFTDITFALQSTQPVKPEGTPRPQIQVQAVLLSLPASEGPPLAAAWKSAGTPIPADSLIRRFQQGGLSCTAQASTVVTLGQLSSISSVRKVQHLIPHAATADPAVSTASASTSSVKDGWSETGCGISLKLEYTQTIEGGDTLNLDLDWDTAPVLPLDSGHSPDTSSASTMVTDTAPASLESRRCQRKLHFTGLPIQRGHPIIADVRPSNARPGTPENGRWHALVLLAR